MRVKILMIEEQQGPRRPKRETSGGVRKQETHVIPERNLHAVSIQFVGFRGFYAQ
jgi:hypothetical protein